MNALKVIVLFAMLVGTALSDGMCSDICKAPCNLAKTGCVMLFSNNAQCLINFNICAAACDNICQCDDQCEGTCRGAADTCVADNDGNLVAQADCNIQFDVCVGACEAQCVVNAGNGIIQSGVQAIQSGVQLLQGGAK